MASDRLRELQDMESQLHSGSEQIDFRSAKDVQLGAGSFRVAGGSSNENLERRPMLRRQGSKASDTWKIWTVVGVTVISCVALLWVLFSGATPDKYMYAPSSKKPLSATELNKLHEEGVRESSCPEPWWLPEECLDDRRTKSKSSLDRCNQIFADYEYSIELLKQCGIIKSGD